MTRARKTLSSWRVAALVLASSLIASTCLAGQPVSLRATLSSTGAITLGDLFEGAGAAAKVVVGNAAPPGLSAVLDAGEVQRIAHVHGLDWDNARGVRRIIVLSAAPAATPLAEQSQPRQTVEALTYARGLNAGETVQPKDVTFTKVAAFTVPTDAPNDAARIIGKVARRPLHLGAAVSAQDVAPSQVIKFNDAVEIVYRDEGINLVLQGRAMSAAAMGEPVSVMNPSSKKIFQAIAVGPDQAVVGPEAERIRAAGQIDSSQFALR
jgi:flagella basal body P-ring formation protein FlgA